MKSTHKLATALLVGVAIGAAAIDFGKLIGEETEKWAKVIKSAGLKAE